MIGLSAALLLFRMFKARGRFMGTVPVQLKAPTDENKKIDNMGPSASADSSGSTTDSMTTMILESPRTVFLPLGHEDGSNPVIKIDQPGSGIFIYCLSQDFNYTNANSYIDHLLTHITSHTRATTVSTATSNGDRPWNDPHLSGFSSKKNPLNEEAEDLRPTLKAVILDFSAVNHVDLTSVQLLVDARNLLERHAKPDVVQWHFANIHSRWTKRALGAAGFGIPCKEAEDGDGGARKWKAIYGVAELATQSSDDDDDEQGKKRSVKMLSKDVESGKVWHSAREERRSWFGAPFAVTSEDIEAAGIANWARDRISIEKDKSGIVMAEMGEVETAPVVGVNRPFFHVSLEVALRCARENVV